MDLILKPERVFYYFEEISKIPRESYKEKQISDYLVAFGKINNLETYQDEKNNVILRKKPFKGYENHKGVILQGHMDMVCEKTEESSHDFEKDPIELKVEGNYLKAKDTTLGGDNGIALAMALAILEDKSLQHGPLEFLATTSEETDLGGALFLKEGILKGSLLINLDSEDEGVITVGSAGGIEIDISLPIKKEPLIAGKNYKVKVLNLLGGHSGIEIDKNRGNANKILGEFLEILKEKTLIKLINISGGSKDNAIPVSSEAIIYSEENIDEKIKEVVSEIKERYAKIESTLEIMSEIIETKFSESFSEKSFLRYLKVIKKIPTGVYTWMKEYKDVVESSDNLAIVKTEKSDVKIIVSLRSSDRGILEELKNKIFVILEENNANYELSNGYPEWKFKKESYLREVALKVYKEMYKKDMKVEVIHAGLECGAISQKYPNIDFISIGPNMKNVHTTRECLDILSTERVYNYLVELLKEL